MGVSKRYYSGCEKTHINNDLDLSDKNNFAEYIQPLDSAVTCNRYINFNAEGLRNDKNSLEYLKIFQKDLYVFSTDIRLTYEKRNILDELAQKYNKLIFATFREVLK